MTNIVKSGLVLLAVAVMPGKGAIALSDSLFATESTAFLAAKTAETPETPDLPLAIGGYDPTLYFAGGLPQPGMASIHYAYEGQLYYFATYQSRQSFIENPEAYAPQYAGHCAFAMSEHRTVRADPTVFQVQDGKLFLFENRMKLDMWKNNSLKFRIVADKRWEVEAKNFSKFKAKF